MLIGGERRYTAIGMLREQGDTRYDLVPCVVVDMDAVDLPLSDELKELYVLTTTNAEQRAKSDYDLMQQVAKFVPDLFGAEGSRTSSEGPPAGSDCGQTGDLCDTGSEVYQYWPESQP